MGEQSIAGTGRTAIGIDLGTSYSRLAYLAGDAAPKCLDVYPGDALLPTAIAVDKLRIAVGREALNTLGLAPRCFAGGFKRDMGRPAYHEKVAGQDVPPEVLSAIVLEHLRFLAQQQRILSRQVVIAVPAHFDELCRKATQEAGLLAGWETVVLINEPTAAALYYGWEMGLFGVTGDASRSGRQRVIVYDLGGGKFDAMLMEIDGPSFRTVAVDGDSQLGGIDFDERLADYIADCCVTTHGFDPRSEPLTAAELWCDAQELKRALSDGTQATTVCRYGSRPEGIEVSRREFEGLTEDLLERTRETTELLVEQAGLSWQQIDRVLVVGGATRMPMVARMLRDLTGKEPDRAGPPERAVALGAAVYAGMLSFPQSTIGRRQCALVNVNSHSLGVTGINERVGLQVNTVLIPRNTPIPARATKSFHTLRDDQRTVSVQVLEGESEQPEFCVSLGTCVIRDLPPGLPRGAVIEVEYCLNADGLLSVSARIPSISQSTSVTIERAHSVLNASLLDWKKRLLQDVSAGHRPAAPNPTKVADLNDRPSIIRRLDMLYTRVGRFAIGASVPSRCSALRQSAITAAEAYKLAHRRLQEIEGQRESEAGGAQANLVEIEIARALTAAQAAAKELDFAYLVLGREIANANFDLPPAVADVSEIHFLRDHLK